MRRALVATFVATAILLAPAAASADTFTNDAPITIPLVGAASPYPSTIHVDGVRGPVVDVQVALLGVTHARPHDLDILLVPPDGHGAVLMSDVCGTTAISNYNWFFSSTGDHPSMGGTCGGSVYRATNVAVPGELEYWPGVAPGNTVGQPADWHHKAMNGDWKLYVVDDQTPASGKIARGWSLQLTTGAVDTFIPSAGPAEHYPSTREVTGRDNQVITGLSVDVPIAHDRISDLQLLLEGPHGQNVLLMAGACGDVPLDQPIFFFDRALQSLPADAGQGGCPRAAKPTDHGFGSDFTPPAAPGPYGSSLSTFDGTTPNGTWKLYARDTKFGGDGYLRDKFTLFVDSRPPAEVAFTDSTVTVPEGATQRITIARSAPTTLGSADVTVSATGRTAFAGADYTPLSQTVHFDRGQAEQTVALDAIADGAAEPDESYSVKLSDPTGDAQLGTQTQVDVTIPASPGNSKPDPPPPPAQRCDGKPATIVGSAGKDVLRGTRGADVIAALGGNDTVTALGGNDTVCGGAGRDRLLGGPGNDRLTGGAGRDTCLGGRGRNRVSCERKVAR